MRQRKWVGDNVKWNIKIIIMKYYLLSISILFLLIGCGIGSKKYNLSDSDELGKYILNSLHKGDKNAINLLYFNENTDSIYADSINYNFSLNEYYEDPNKFGSLDSTLKVYKNYYTQYSFSKNNNHMNEIFSNESNFVKKNINIDSIKNVRTFMHNSIITEHLNSYFIYFQNTDSINYLLYIENPYLKNDTIRFTNYKLLNLEKCNEYFIKSYTYYFLINLHHLNWEFKPYEPTHFESLYLSIKNDSKFDFNNIKFKIKFSKNENFDDILFTKTLEKEIDLKSGDDIRLSLNELTNIPIGFNVNKNNFKYTANLIEINPFPYYKEFNPNYK